MAERSRKRTQKSSFGFSGNHQRSWLWGRHAVSETLLAGAWPVREIYATREAYDQFAELLQRERQQGVSVEVVSTDRLEQLCRSSEHQGIVARMGDYPYRPQAEFEQALRCAVEAHNARRDALDPSDLCPLVVLCDRIQDTFNFGAILRCCDGAKVLGVVVGEHAQSLVTPHVARSSSGAVNHIDVVRTTDLCAAAQSIKSLGWQLVAADSNAGQSVWDSDLSGFTALVIGSEAHGIRSDLLELCDQRVCIPMHGQVTSLNAAVAAGILLYEIRRQQLSVSTQRSRAAES